MRKFTLLLFCILNTLVYAQPITFDNTFGVSGIAKVDFGSSFGSAFSQALQTDGKIIAVGDVSHNWAVVRLNSNGNLDSTFGTDGKIVQMIGNDDSYAKSIVIQSDGKILVAGFSSNGSDWDYTLVRYNTDGSLDASFDSDGIVSTDLLLSDYVYSVKLQPDGKIVVAGNSGSYFSCARYNSDGSLDTSFGSGGKVMVGIYGIDDVCTSILVQNDGKLILTGGGQIGINTSPFYCAVLRLNTNGSIDSTYDGDGILEWQMGSGSSAINDATLQMDNKLIVTGISYNNTSAGDIILCRINSDGTFDSTFNSVGKVFTDLGGTPEAGYSVTLQNDGKILVAGLFNNGNPNSDFLVLRYNSNGSVDSTFDNDGFVITSIGTNDDHASSVLLQSDGKILVSGFSYDSGSYDFAFVRYVANSFTGTEEDNELNSFIVYPNPSSGFCTVSTQKVVRGKIVVFDLLGNCVLNKTIQNEYSSQIDLSSQPKGIYFMEVVSNGKRSVNKIILQ